MRRFLLGLAVVILLAFAVLYALRGPLTLRAMDRVIASNMATSLMDELPDGLHVALCGAGSPLPDPRRSGPCTAVIAGDRLFVVDAGSGSSRVMSRMRIPQGRIEAVLLTHFHSDHIDGLGELLLQRWANGGHETPVPLIGPEGVAEVAAGFDRAYAQSRRYRVAHHGEDVVPPSGAGAAPRAFPAPAPGDAHVVIDDGGLTVTAFRVEHEPVDPAVGYRFDYAGRSVVISGDTVRSRNVERFADGVDLLVHEALDPELVERLTEGARAAGRTRVAKITEDILDYHTPPEEAAAAAEAAGARHLLFNHVVPPLLLAPMEAIFLEGVDAAYDGPVTIGIDGTLVRMPADSEAITVEERL